jgi:hypothetical protein
MIEGTTNALDKRASHQRRRVRRHGRHSCGRIGGIAATDFFTTEVWTWHGLVTFYTVFVIDLASGRVCFLGTTPHPDEAFMRQIAPTLTMADAET